jgi:hypothetical protein
VARIDYFNDPNAPKANSVVRRSSRPTTGTSVLATTNKDVLRNTLPWGLVIDAAAASQRPSRSRSRMPAGTC